MNVLPPRKNFCFLIPSLTRLFYGLLLGLIIFTSQVVAADLGTDIITVTDTSLIRRLWQHAYPDSTPPTGDYRVWFIAADSNQENEAVAFLHNGTEIYRDDGTYDEFQNARARAGVEGENGIHDPFAASASFSIWDELKATPKKWESWMIWPAGLKMSAGMALGGMRGADPEMERHYAATWEENLFHYFLCGAGFRWDEYGGGLNRSLHLYDTSSNADWFTSYAGFTFELGAPGILYQLETAGHPFPEYYWLEKPLPIIRSHSKGVAISAWDDSSYDSNWRQKITLRLGAIRYTLLFDFDSYRSLVQHFGLEDLSIGSGHYGIGLLVARHILAPTLYLELFPTAFLFAKSTAYPVALKTASVHFDFQFAGPSTLYLGLSLRLHIDNPIMHFSGEKL